MGSIFSKPKARVIEPPKTIPVADDQMQIADKRRKQAARIQQKGLQSTVLSNQATTMENKPVGQ